MSPGPSPWPVLYPNPSPGFPRRSVFSYSWNKLTKIVYHPHADGKAETCCSLVVTSLCHHFSRNLCDWGMYIQQITYVYSPKNQRAARTSSFGRHLSWELLSARTFDQLASNTNETQRDLSRRNWPESHLQGNAFIDPAVSRPLTARQICCKQNFRTKYRGNRQSRFDTFNPCTDTHPHLRLKMSRNC